MESRSIITESSERGMNLSHGSVCDELELDYWGGAVGTYDNDNL